MAESWFTGSAYIARTIADANLIEIHAKISELLGKQVYKCANTVVVHASLQQSEMEEEEKKTTSPVPNYFIEGRTS